MTQFPGLVIFLIVSSPFFLNVREIMNSFIQDHYQVPKAAIFTQYILKVTNRLGTTVLSHFLRFKQLN